MNILQALCDYAERRGGLPPTGFVDKPVPCIIVIDADGSYVGCEIDDGDRGTPVKTYRIVNITRSSNTEPGVFCDNGEYLLGIVPEKKMNPNWTEDQIQDAKKKQQKKTDERHRVFVGKCQDLACCYPQNRSFQAVCAFYQRKQVDVVRNSLDWDRLLEQQKKNFSFRVQGETGIVAEDSDLKDYLEKKGQGEKNRASQSVCLVSGKKCIPTLTSNTVHVAGGQTSGVRIVSFQVNSGYDSYGKKQGDNAPISQDASDAYTNALSILLAKDSRNKLVVGKRTYVFWASRSDEAGVAAEDALSTFLGFQNEDDPNQGVERFQKILNSIYSGILTTNLDDKFFVLGLGPNAARVAVTDWQEIPLKDFAGFLLSYLDDMEIVDIRRNPSPYKGLYGICSSLSVTGDQRDTPDNLKDALFKSIIQDLPFPVSVAQSVIRRIRADQNVSIIRAALLKAYLNRLSKGGQRMAIMLDKTNTDAGYLCGRLFATLEYIQNMANSGKSTIGSRFIGAASSTPAAVFGTLLGLSLHHEEKLGKKLRDDVVGWKKEIMNKLPASGFPARLSLQEQATFFVGYYHQKQAFSTKTDNSVNDKKIQ